MEATRTEFDRFTHAFMAEIEEIYNDLQKTPVVVLLAISCLALLFAATILFGFHL